jgi:HSP20 family protein
MSPWDLVRRMGEELDQLAQGLGVARPTAGSGGNGDLTEWVPRIEVRQQPDALKVRADLPGLAPQNIEVSVDDGMLTIRGERRQERTTEDDGFVRSEVVYGTFFRTLPLPAGADDNRVDAKFRDGVLEITVPVEGRQAGRRIPVQSEATT